MKEIYNNIKEAENELILASKKDIQMSMAYSLIAIAQSLSVLAENSDKIFKSN